MKISPWWLLMLPLAASANDMDTGRQVAGKFKQSLMHVLTQAVQGGGPVAGINVCHGTAKVLAEQLGKAHGVTLGRIGTRTRSPANAPVAHWQQVLLKTMEQQPQPQLVAVDGKRFYIEPLRIQAQCLVCHGSPEPAVKTALAKYYPDDQATGYQLGELRGLVWVQLPLDNRSEDPQDDRPL